MPSFSANTIEFAVFVVVVGLVLLLGMAAARWRRPASMDALDEWGLGGRAFGTGISFFLLGGDIYTAYTFVAVPAMIFGAGAQGFFAVAFTTIMFPLAYVTLPRMWSVAHVHGFVTPAEFVKVRFGSRSLSALVAVAAIAGTMPYIALQLIGIEVVFEAMGMDGRIPLLVAFALLALSTFRSGLRAPALMAVAKDAFILVIVVSVLFGLAGTGVGWSRIFRDAAAKFAGTPGSGGLLLPSAGQLDYVTLALGSALALFLYPHVMTGVLATRNRATLRRTLRVMPLYTFGLGIIALFGFVAISAGIRPLGAGAGGRGGDPNTVVPQVFHDLLGNWGAGAGYAAIGIGALVPAAIMSIAAANLFSRCVYKEFIRPGATAAQEARVSRWASLTVKLGAVLAILLLTPEFSVELQLMGGVVILQVLPAVVIGLYTAWFHRLALIIGLITGLVSGVVMLYQIPGESSRHFGGSSWPLAHLGLHTPITIYAGLIALAANLLMTVAATLVLRRIGIPGGPDGTQPWHYVADESDLTIQRMAELVDGQQPYAGKHAGARPPVARLPGQRGRDRQDEARGPFEPAVRSAPGRPGREEDRRR